MGFDDTLPLRDIGGKHVVLLLSRRQSDTPDPAHRHMLAELTSEQAITLVQELGGQRVADRSCVAQLVRYTGGYPLALRIIGNYLSFHQEEIADYLRWFEQSGLAALDQGKHHLESVLVLLQRTYASLQPNEQNAFALQGLLAPAPFPLELVQNILGLPEREMRQTLGSLVNLSVLLRRNLTYEVSHPFVHTFAKEHLSAQVQTASFPSPETIATWRKQIVKTLTSHFKQSNPYNRSALTLWQPHVLPLLSITDLTAAQGLEAAYLFNRVGLAARTQGKYAEAEPLFERALAISEAQLGDTHPHTATSLNNLALLYSKQGKYTEAEPLFERALAICEVQLGPDHPTTKTVRQNYLLLQKKIDEKENKG
jgi:tetratricopeptide (TPR) repeat protein